MCTGLIHHVPTCGELAKCIGREAEGILDKSNASR